MLGSNVNYKTTGIKEVAVYFNGTKYNQNVQKRLKINGKMKISMK